MHAGLLPGAEMTQKQQHHQNPQPITGDNSQRLLSELSVQLRSISTGLGVSSPQCRCPAGQHLFSQQSIAPSIKLGRGLKSCMFYLPPGMVCICLAQGMVIIRRCGPTDVGVALLE